ncbi:MAG: GTP 3',8-cyclase MoaA [Flavobacterium sp.]|nr:GTP 3',8-cyclase MoaA [Aeromicrobium sp.]
MLEPVNLPETEPGADTAEDKDKDREPDPSHTDQEPEHILSVCVPAKSKSAGLVAATYHGRMELIDGYDRVATDLRVSLTDRCNLRCQYCMPAEGLDWMPTEETLTDAELIRLIGIGVEILGVRDVRFTGGEPLLRRSLPAIIAATKALPSNPRTAMTSNGLGLKHTAVALAEAGLDRVNISLDTTDPDTFEKITRRNRLHDVIDGLAAAHEAGLTPVKVNAVLLRGINDTEAPDLLRWCLKHGYELRFIEQMPLDAQHGWTREAMVTADETLALLAEHFTLTGLDGRGSAPAEKFLVDGGPHTVGIIGSVTRPFCGDCNRVRLTADGQIRNCLFAREESDLRAALRGGASDDDIARRWAAAMMTKLPGHGIDDPNFLQPTRSMSAIGG